MRLLRAPREGLVLRLAATLRLELWRILSRASCGLADKLGPGIFACDLISLPFLAIVAAMGYELSSEVVRAAHLVRDLEASEAALRESDARFGMLADSAPVMVWM